MKISGPVGRKKKKKTVSFAPLVEESASYNELCGYVGLKPAPKSTSGSSSNEEKMSTAVAIPKPSMPSNHKMVPRYFHDEEPRRVPKPVKPRRLFDESTVNETVKDDAGKDGAGKDGAGKDGAGKDGAGKSVDTTIGFSKVIIIWIRKEIILEFRLRRMQL